MLLSCRRNVIRPWTAVNIHISENLCRETRDAAASPSRPKRPAHLRERESKSGRSRTQMQRNDAGPTQSLGIESLLGESCWTPFHLCTLLLRCSHGSQPLCAAPLTASDIFGFIQISLRLSSFTVGHFWREIPPSLGRCSSIT